MYPPGGYGTFIEWCLNYFTGQTDQVPFQDTGSSHEFRGHPLGFDLPWSMTTAEYFNSNDNYSFARTHATLPETQSVKDYTVMQYINAWQGYTKKFIVLNSTVDSRLMILNNATSKIKTHDMSVLVNSVTDMFQDQFRASLPVPTWQLREMFSYWFDRTTQIQLHAYAPIDHPQVINISIRDLVDNFDHTMICMFEQLGLQMKQKGLINSIYKTWIRLQKHTKIDYLLTKIINSTVNNIDFDWRDHPLQLHEEGFVQWQLRDLHNLDLLCYNLDVFPTNSVELRKLLINV